MSRTARFSWCATILLAGIAALAPPALAAWSTAPYLTTAPISSSTGYQRHPVCVSDGSGGSFVAWQEVRPVSFTVVAQHVLANGVVDPAWPASGLVVAPSVNNQTNPKIIADGTGGMIVTWLDSGNLGDVYAQRLTGAGAIAPGWPAAGVAVAATLVEESHPSICTDGAGGVIVVYEYTYSSSDHDIYAARVTASGTLIPWPAVYAPTSSSHDPAVCSDLAGGCYVAFSDNAGVNLIKILAAHVNSSGSAIYAPSALFGIAPYQGYQPLIDVDGSGGAFVAWTELGTGDADVLINRLGPTQAPIQPFYLNAVRVSAVTGSNQILTGLAYDGAGGALVTFDDYRYGPNPQASAMRILANAQQAPGWPQNGVALGYTGAYQAGALPAPDGTGGGSFVWYDARGGTFGGALYATRLSAAGAVAPHWGSNGAPFVLTNTSPPDFAVCPDARRGVIAAVEDYRLGQSQTQIWAARLDRYGALGDVQPSIASVKDVPADQGGKVKLTWNACLLDLDPTLGIGSYWIWRQVPATVAAQAVRAGARWIEDLPAGGSPARGAGSSPDGALATAQTAGLYRHAGTAAVTYAWEYLLSQPANGSAQYSYIAATTSDSTAAHHPYTLFMVEAHDAGSTAFWDSAPDSGYSVDNIPPAIPAPFTAAYIAGASHLHWGANTEADLAGYRLYKGTSAGFVPGPGNLVVALPDTGYVSAGGAGNYYKLSAVDMHDNESQFALLGPGTTTDVGGGVRPQELSLASPRPNPASSQVLFSFALPEGGPVTLAIYDTEGRLMRTVSAGRMDAGEYHVPFDLHDDRGGRIPNGLYFVRLELGAQLRVRRLAIVN